MTVERGRFSRLGFVVAAAGSAIGLGNLWKFPYITYENGGGSFVLVYLAAVLLIGAPIMMAEILIGRRTQQSPVGAFLVFAKQAAGGKIWTIIGWMGVIGGFVILSYYSVVAGWTLYYIYQCVGWSTQGFPADVAANLGPLFGNFVSDGALQITLHGIFMLLTMLIVMLGVQKGIEQVTKILLPFLFLILIVLVIDSTTTDGFAPAMGFLFHFSRISTEGILEAVGQAFFSLSLGMGAMITYGSYIAKTDSIPKAAATVCFLDTLVAFLACFVMFSIIFAVPQAERAGTFSASAAILFTTMPRMLYGMPGGEILAPAFYLLVAFAALTSTISLLEVVVAYFIDRLQWTRAKASLVVGVLIFAIGVFAALSLGASEGLSNWQPLGAKSTGVFDTLDYLATNWLLPMGGLLIALFAGWAVSSQITRTELELGHGSFSLHWMWKWCVRLVCPLAIGYLLYQVIFEQVKFN